MAVTYKVYENARVFRELTFPFLLRDEAAHCLGLGVIQSLIDKPEQHIDFRLAAFFDEASEEDLLGVAWVSTPQALGASAMPEDCLPALIKFASNLPQRPSGISAPFAIAEGFRSAWQGQTRCKVQHRFEQRIYELNEVVMPAEVPGAMRPARKEDFAILCEWSWNFVVDCGMAKGRDHGYGKTYARQALLGRSRYFWVVKNRPVAMAAVRGETPEGIRISWVYTPKGERGKGYASRLVAELCRMQLERGKKRCFLYTDLANPTSNHIYQTIGFKPVANPLHYGFAYDMP